MKSAKIQKIVALLLEPDVSQVKVGMAIDEAYGWGKIKWLPKPIAKFLEKSDDALNYEIAGMLIDVVREIKQRSE